MENLKTTLLSTVSLIMSRSSDKNITAQDIIQDKNLIIYENYDEEDDFVKTIYIHKDTDDNISCYLLDGNDESLDLQDDKIEISNIYISPNVDNVIVDNDRKNIFFLKNGKKKLFFAANKHEDINSILSDSGLAEEAFIKSAYEDIFISSQYVDKIPDNCFASSYALTSFQSTSPIDSICNYAFEKCLNLLNVEISSCLSICNCSFLDCISLANVKLPQNLEYIGNNAFMHCIDLSNINLQETKVKKISQHAFDWCSSLTEVQFPTALQEIDYNAFLNCDSLSVFSFKGFDHVIDISKLNPIISYNIVVPDNLVDEWKASSPRHAQNILSETEFSKNS